MQKVYAVWVLLTVMTTYTGCVDTGVMRSTHGQTVLKAFASTVENATKGLEQGLVVIKIRAEQAKAQQIGMFTMGDPFAASFAGTLNGIILTKAGHVLVPRVIKPDLTKRIEIWIGEKEYSAKFVKTDESLGMSILKIDTEDKLSPVDISTCTDLPELPGTILLRLRAPLPGGQTDLPLLRPRISSQGESANRRTPLMRRSRGFPSPVAPSPRHWNHGIKKELTGFPRAGYFIRIHYSRPRELIPWNRWS